RASRHGIARVQRAEGSLRFAGGPQPMGEKRAAAQSFREVDQRFVEQRGSQAVSAGWAVSMPLDGAVAAAPLRQAADVEACVVLDRLWLRGTAWNDALDRSLRKILGAARFHRLADHETARWGDILAS